MNKEEFENHIFKNWLKGTEDKSWKVRLALSNKLHCLFNVFGNDFSDFGFLSIFKKAISDQEPEV